MHIKVFLFIQCKNHERAFKMKHSRPFVEGTIILTISSLFSRCIGFCNRIFLSNLIGAHQMGIYQLIFPIYLVGFSFCFQGFETALTKIVSSLIAKHRKKESYLLLNETLKFSLLLSLIFVVIVEFLAQPICVIFLHETSCVICLRIALLALPFVGIKGSFHSYSTGLGKPGISAISLCLEQVIRVLSIYVISLTFYSMLPVPALIAVLGMVIGEILSCIFTVAAFYHFHTPSYEKKEKSNYFSHLLNLGIPLTCNNLCVTVLSSIENILIPLSFTLFYENGHYAIELYGIITGMTLPFILFPSTVTNALSTMLVPKVSETLAKQNMTLLRQLETKSIGVSIFIGTTSFVLFHMFGNTLGNLVFHNQDCGRFLTSMSFLCPFLYVSGTLSSILNGLGKTKITLLHNVISLSIRIVFILLIVPVLGINGYFLGLLTSSMLQVILNYRSILNF
jgi:stage V sporulation protein B